MRSGALQVVSAAQCTCLLPYLSSSASSLKDGKNIPVPAEGMEAGVESSVPPQGSRSVAVSCLGEALPAPGPDLLSQLRLNFTISLSFFPQKAAQQHTILKLVQWGGDWGLGVHQGPCSPPVPRSVQSSARSAPGSQIMFLAQRLCVGTEEHWVVRGVPARAAQVQAREIWGG